VTQRRPQLAGTGSSGYETQPSLASSWRQWL